MADDLNFKHAVSQVPAQENLPNPIQKNVSIQVHDNPSFQASVNNYADSTNWMSSIGSYVAAKSSNAIATKLGTELGKNPKGDIGIPLTDFDTVLQNSYKNQAQSTLGIQANKLILDSNLELAKSPRISTELINKTNKSISQGLNNIFNHAPEEVRTNLENQFGNKQIEYMAQLSERMIREHKEDQRNNTAVASQINSENAYSFALNGNYEAANKAVTATESANNADVMARLTTPETAKANIDAARKSFLSGKYIHEYEKANAVGKGEAYLKNLADNKPKDISDPDYMTVTNAVIGYVGHQQSLRNQDEQLRLAKFGTAIAKDINSITPAQFSELKENVTPIQYEAAQLAYIKAMKANQASQGSLILTTQSWNDPEAFARIPEKQVNQGFDVLVNKYIQTQSTKGNAITTDEAEVQIAASAAGKVPVFVNGISNKINSANPAMMDSAARQIDELYSMNASHALSGLPDHDKAIYTQFKALRDSLPPEEAAKIAIQNANQDPDTQTMNKEKWAAFIKSKTNGVLGNTSPTKYALSQVNLHENDFMNPGIANVYGNLILEKYGTFFQMLNGDKQTALNLTKKSVEENFGYTSVNGQKVLTLHPLEKVLGYEEGSNVVPFIQNDVMEVLGKHFIPAKEAFNTRADFVSKTGAAHYLSNEYWDIVKPEEPHHGIFKNTYNPIQVKRYTRVGNKVHSDTYNVVLLGNSFNWDIAVQTSSGLRPLIQLAPYLGLTTYTPNKKAIDNAYRKKNSHE